LKSCLRPHGGVGNASLVRVMRQPPTAVHRLQFTSKKAFHEQLLQPVPISPVEEIVAEMRAGRMVVLVDEEDRENEGDLVLASDHVTPEAINFMARFGRGLICLTLTRERCEFLKLPPMAARNGTVLARPSPSPSKPPKA
jgi:hypothetical protein